MDRRLREIADAFGNSNYGQCLLLAEALLESTDDANLRVQAVSYLVESRLAQGQFDAARKAAERLRPLSTEDYESARSRIDRKKTTYMRAVGRLQRLVTDAPNLGEAVWGQLLSGHLHQQAGLLDLAQKSYWKVVSHHSDHAPAASALYQVAEMHRMCGEPDDAATVYKLAVDATPDSALAVLACEEISRLCTAHEACSSEQARQHLQEVAIAHPERKAGDWARFLVGQLYADEGRLQDADGMWAALVAERPQSHAAREALPRLVELRHDIAMRAYLDGDYERAADWFARLLPHLTSSGSAEQCRHVMFCLGEAYQKLGRWDQAAGTFRLLAVPGNPAEEVALFELGRSELQAGNHERAVEAFTALMDRFPESGFIAQCDDRIQTIQGER